MKTRYVLEKFSESSNNIKKELLGVFKKREKADEVIELRESEYKSFSITYKITEVNYYK